MISCRNIRSEDREFVIAAWSSSFKSSHYAGIVSSEDWPEIMHRQLRKILERPRARALVACDERVADFLYGFIVGEIGHRVPVLHYVYCKAPYRRAGIARALFAALGVDPEGPFLYTCRTPVVSQLAHPSSSEPSKIPRATFCPAAARYTNYQEQHEQRQR